jgi:hypothetical protein
VNIEEEAQDEEYPSSFPSDAHASYRSHAAFSSADKADTGDDDGDDDLSNSHIGPQAAFDTQGRRMRALCLHEVIAVYPVGIPLLHSAVGRFFSSFNASLNDLQSAHAGWQGWHMLHDPADTMSRVMSAAGFINHHAFESTHVRQQLNNMDDDPVVLQACAESDIEDEHHAASLAAGRSPRDWPFDAAAHADAIAARAQHRRQKAEARLDPRVWCLRDALACLCVHMLPHAAVEQGGECNATTCRLANTARGTRVEVEPETGREMHRCRRGQTHSYMTDHVKGQHLKAERKRAKLAGCMPRPPKELLRAACNTADLERLLQGKVTATDTCISFLDMPSDDWNCLWISRAWVLESKAGRAVMEDMRRCIPLYRFFALSTRMLATLPDVLTCNQHHPMSFKQVYIRNNTSSSLLNVTFVRHHTHNACDMLTPFRLVLPDATFEQVRQYRTSLRATQGRSLTGQVEPC